MLKRAAGWLVVVLAMALIAGGLVHYKASQIMAAAQSGASRPEPAEAVVTARARMGTVTATTRAIGTVVAVRQIEIRNEIAGAISKMGFKSGDVVQAGQVLVEFDVRQEQAALAAVEAESRLAQSTLERREALRASPANSPQELDKSRADFEASTARARNLAVVIDKKKIAAPFRGRIGITDLQPGAYLDAGTLIARLQGIDEDAFVDFSLPQESAAMMRKDVSVEMRNPGIPGGAATARVIAEDNSIDAASRTIRFRATLVGLGGALRPGAFVDVLAETAPPRGAVLVPLAAVRHSPAGKHVFVVTAESGSQRARQRTVVTGVVAGEEIEIAKGLSEGELIAAAGSFKLRDGMLLAADASAGDAKAH